MEKGDILFENQEKVKLSFFDYWCENRELKEINVNYKLDNCSNDWSGGDLLTIYKFPKFRIEVCGDGIFANYIDDELKDHVTQICIALNIIRGYIINTCEIDFILALFELLREILNVENINDIELGKARTLLIKGEIYRNSNDIIQIAEILKDKF